MRLRSAFLEELELPLVEPFETSFGVERRRRFLLLSLETEDGRIGWGECVAARAPGYSDETVATARRVLLRRLLPSLTGPELPSPTQFGRRIRGDVRHPMARATVELALADLAAQANRQSLSRFLGGTKSRVEVGVSVGIQKTVLRLVRRVARYLDEGYHRVKLKVRPGWDEAPVAAVRREFPDAPLWIDANQAYSVGEVPRLARLLGRYAVEQIEQPFATRALAAHATLGRRGDFRVCLDESIVNAESLDRAIDARAISALNLKPGRVGGVTVARDLLLRSRRAGIPNWVGGMLESGIGRAHGVALASHPAVDLSSDLSASRRYYRQDLIDPPFELGPRSTLPVPHGPGLGVTVVESVRRRFRRWGREFRPGKVDNRSAGH